MPQAPPPSIDPATIEAVTPSTGDPTVGGIGSHNGLAVHRSSLFDDRLRFDSSDYDRLTHYLFRYPAKFHPPVARTLIERFSEPGQHVLDPFCGSGTLLVEAATVGRHAVGTDIDPVAVFVSRLKTRCYNVEAVRRTAEHVLGRLERLERSAEEYERRMFEDIEKDEMWATVDAEDLWVPKIPNLLHWFRKYVVVDLARMLRVIDDVKDDTHREFLRLCFASIIRGASNADPVPVSGLEYTSHMREKDAKGRLVNPFKLYRRTMKRSLKAIAAYREKAHAEAQVKVHQNDALRLADAWTGPMPDLIITSPPYHNAVNYYRRHQLEMFWLSMTETQKDRVAIKHDYIGRPSVRVNDPFLSDNIDLPPRAATWYQRMQAKSPKRARAFKHYTVAMQQTMRQIARLLRPGARAVFVIGHSTWNKQELRTTPLFQELVEDHFDTERILWYPLKNRYMSFTRHNGASIDREYVIVLRRR